MQVFLQPVDVEHYRDTVINGRRISELSSLNSMHIDALSEIFQNDKISIWGVESDNAIKYWTYINENKDGNDVQICFFYQKGKIVGLGNIVYSCINPDLANTLWDSSAWSHIYFIKDFEALDLPIHHFNSLIGAKYDNVKGFHRVNKNKAKSIEKSYSIFRKKITQTDQNIPDDITREHILKAVEDYKEGVIVHCFIDSRDYDVIINEEEFPPKAIIGLASRYTSKGRVLLPSEFSAGLNKKCFTTLEDCGFSVKPKSEIRKKLYKTRKSYANIIDKLSQEDDLNKKVQSYYRKEQKILSDILFEGIERERCAICGEEYPVSFLVTGHIKKRSACSKQEQLDFENVVMPVCKFGCDDLYEKGYIKVDSEGIIYDDSISKSSTSFMRSYIQKLNGRVCYKHNDKSERYFKWHREHHKS